MSTRPSLLTIREAATRLGVHESTVRRYADRGLIGVRRLPSGVRRLSEADVDALGRRIDGGGPHDARGRADVAAAIRRDRHAPPVAGGTAPVTIENLDPVAVWESSDELGEFLRVTYQERDRDR